MRKVWYLTHHPVLNLQKPGKMRIVFDCTTTYQGISLNLQVWQGPDLNKKLLCILLRFWQGKIAWAADIKVMFHQLLVPEKEREVLCLLWRWSDRPNAPVKVFQMSRHIFWRSVEPSMCSVYIAEDVQGLQAELRWPGTGNLKEILHG